MFACRAYTTGGFLMLASVSRVALHCAWGPEGQPHVGFGSLDILTHVRA
jgi:hypothetical protein